MPIVDRLALEAPHICKLNSDDSAYDDEDEENEEESFEEEGFDEDAYEAAIGTRPELPSGLMAKLNSPAYNKVLGIFYACTEEDPDKRPSAKMILDSLKA